MRIEFSINTEDSVNFTKVRSDMVEENKKEKSIT